MKKTLFLLTIIALITSVVFAEEHEQERDLDRDLESAEMKLEMGHLELKNARQHAEFEFENEMRQLELEQRRLEINNFAKGPKNPHKAHPSPCLMFFVLATFVVHILSTIWVYKDMDQRKNRSGLWVAIVLLGGLLALIPYSIIRLVEPPQPE